MLTKEMIARMKAMIEEGAARKEQGAAIYLAAMMYSDHFDGTDYNELCHSLGLKLTSEKEIKKALALKCIMERHGYVCTKKP